jgi:hypothetical protein
VPLADLAEQVRGRDLRVLQDQRASSTSPAARVCALLSAADRGKAALDDEGAEGAVSLSRHRLFANTMNTSANPPLVIHIFSPLEREAPVGQPRGARAGAEASEPEPDSLSA